RRHAQQHVDLVWHCLTLHQFDILLTAQVPQDLADAPSEPSVQHLATVLRKDHDVILAVPLDMGLTLPILHGGPPAPRGLPRGGPSHLHAGNGRAFRVAPPEAVDLLLIKAIDARPTRRRRQPDRRTPDSERL